jgi:hypothetical protein
MALATWNELETIEGIIGGLVTPEALPFAQLSTDEQAAVINEIDDVIEDVAPSVTERYAELDNPAQRNDRLRAYREELLRRKDPSVRDAWASYFDALMGVCLRNASAPRNYSIDESGVVVTFAA